MKKLLLLLLFSTTASANPYAEAIKIHSAVYSYIEKVSPTLYMLNACNSYLYVPTLMFSVEQTYNLVPANAQSYEIVNTMQQKLPSHESFAKFSHFLQRPCSDHVWAIFIE